MASLTVYSSPGYQGHLRLNQDIERYRNTTVPLPISYQLWPGFEHEYYAMVALWRRWLNTGFGWQKDTIRGWRPAQPGGREQVTSVSHSRHYEQSVPPPPQSFRTLTLWGGGGETMKSLGRLWCRPRGSKPPASQWDGNDCNELPGLLCLRGFHNETAVAAVLTA